VVFDVNVYIDAVIKGGGGSAFTHWPILPPKTTNPAADCIGLANDAREYSLWISEHIFSNIEWILNDLFKWSTDRIDAYLNTLTTIAERSGGSFLDDVPCSVHDCPDYEDNMILDLAVEVGALIIVSNDSDLLHMNPWRSTLILNPARFAAIGDAHRRPGQQKH
jgi:predicted nucleic acid-binding protein